MKYLVAEFKIECQDGMIQIARDLLTDALGEAGFETFEDTEDGIKGYVQESLFDENAMNDVISNFMLLMLQSMPTSKRQNIRTGTRNGKRLDSRE